MAVARRSSPPPAAPMSSQQAAAWPRCWRPARRYCEQVLLLCSMQADLNRQRVVAKRIGGPLLFGPLWEETGCKAVIEALLAERLFEFPVERAVFATVLHRLMVSGSDRACEKWMTDYAMPGID